MRDRATDPVKAIFDALDDLIATLRAAYADAAKGRAADPGDSADTDMPPAVLDRVQACEYIGIKPTKLYELTVTGKLPSLTIGRRRLYRRAALDQWLADLEAAQGA